MSRTETRRKPRNRAVTKAPVKADDPFVKTRGVSKERLAEQFDYSTKCRVAIRGALKKIPVGTVWTDADMRQECGVSGSHGWRDVADEKEFLKYQFAIGDRNIFWAQPKTVAWACTNVAKARKRESD